jgi:hypothetical protein
MAVRAVEGLDADAELVRMPADLVERDEAVIAIEGGVLEALGHHRATILLQLHRAAQHRLATEAAARPRDEVARQQLLHEVEDARIDRGLGAPRPGERPVEVAPIGVGRRTLGVDIGAVDREAGNHLAQGAVQDVVGKVSRAGILPGDAAGIAREHVQFARHLVTHDAQLRVAHDRREWV